LEPLADTLASRPWDHAVVLADGELEGIAEEGALAFKEICQLPSNYYHMLDVRHGPMVLINEKTLVIAAVGSIGSELERNLLRDVLDKKAELVMFSDTPMCVEGIAPVNNKINAVFFGSGLPHMAKGIPFIVLCQMIAYYKSEAIGTDPDKPTGLDAWISL
jgi:fructoselysine-6-P-deglycase FrlB-like protein